MNCFRLPPPLPVDHGYLASGLPAPPAVEGILVAVADRDAVPLQELLR